MLWLVGHWLGQMDHVEEQREPARRGASQSGLAAARRPRAVLKVGRERVQEEGGDARRHERPQLLPVGGLVELLPLLARQHRLRELAQIVAEQRGGDLGQLTRVHRVEHAQQPLEAAGFVNHRLQPRRHTCDLGAACRGPAEASRLDARRRRCEGRGRYGRRWRRRRRGWRSP